MNGYGRGVIPTWTDCAGLSPELRCWRLQITVGDYSWRLQIGNLSIDTEGLWRRRAPPSGASQLVVPHSERQDMIRQFHDSLFAGHLGVSRTVLIRVDVSCVLHPFSVHKLDAGPIRLVTIAHAFNYRMAVMRDGVKSAIRDGRSHKAEGWFLTDTDLSWGQQVAVMFQIISTLTLEVPSFLKYNVQLYSEPWGRSQ